MRLIDADALKKHIDYTADLGGWVGDTILEIKRLAKKYIDVAPTIEPEQKWIPVRYHYITDEERQENGYPKDWGYHLDCELPDDGDEILVTNGKQVWVDDCYVEDGYSLDSGNDWIDIAAWMPFPKPWDGTFAGR